MGSFLTTRLSYLPTQKEADTSVSTAVQPRKVSDEYLLSRLRARDVEALAQLFDRCAKIIRHIGRKILRDDSEADDLVQDLFLFLERKYTIFDSSKSSARSWIIQMAYQRAIERRRYLAARHFYAHSESQDCVERLVGKLTIEDDYSPEAVFGRNGLEKVFGVLSDDQRETLRLYFFDGYTLAEISAKLGQPLGNVRNHYYRGLEKLRDQMFAKNHQRGG